MESTVSAETPLSAHGRSVFGNARKESGSPHVINRCPAIGNWLKPYYCEKEKGDFGKRLKNPFARIRHRSEDLDFNGGTISFDHRCGMNKRVPYGPLSPQRSAARCEARRCHVVTVGYRSRRF
jgi:hypothetical protein